MTQGFIAIGMGMVIVISSSGIALAGKTPACNVVGDWTATVTGTTTTTFDFQMTSQKGGTTNYINPYCNGGVSKIIKSKTKKNGAWAFDLMVPRCAPQARATLILNSACNAGGGDITSPAGVFKMTVTEVSAARHSPGRPSTALMSTLK